MITTAPINLQTIASKQLEIGMDWFLGTGTMDSGNAPQGFDLFLRTNGTLPGFNENWQGRNDPSVRAEWFLCPNMNVAHCGGNGFMAFYTPHAIGATINQEGGALDQVIGGNFNATNTGTDHFVQLVLNETGGSNWYWHTNGGGTIQQSTSAQQAGFLQPGQDYWIVLESLWASSPCASCGSVFRVAGNGPNLPTEWGMWAVPAACDDAKNKVACAPSATNPPNFGLNWDPSTWGAGIAKAFEWVFTNIFGVLSLIYQVISPVFISALDSLGGFLGIGNVGTQIANFFVTISAWFSNVFGFAFSTSLSLVTFLANSITFLNEILGGFFSGIAGAIGALVAIFGFLTPILNLIFITAHVSIGTLISLDMFMGIFMCFSYKTHGWKAWFQMNEMLFLKLFKAAYWIGDEVFKLIARLRTIGPRPAGI
jgi:hypothetical protein